MTDEAIDRWRENKEAGKKGRPRIYSNEAILCLLMIRAVYNLPLRALRGLALSLTALMGLSLPIPCYTHICRRAKELEMELKKLSRRRPTDIVFDSSGVKIYGEGEWKVRQHGKAKRRTWRKIHLAIYPNSHEVILSELTDRSQTDDAVAKQMTPKLPKSVRNAYGDGAYDKQGFYLACHAKGITPLTPLRK